MENSFTETSTEEVTKKPKKRGRKPKPKLEPETSGPYQIGGDEAALVITCEYHEREGMRQQVFDEVGIFGEGLKLSCAKCGTSILYQAADRIPTSNVPCGSGKHLFVKWISIR